MLLPGSGLQNAITQAVLAAQAGQGWRGGIHPDTLERCLKLFYWLVFFTAIGLVALFKQQVSAGQQVSWYRSGSTRGCCRLRVVPLLSRGCPHRHAE
jgi:hypothetical protein